MYPIKTRDSTADLGGGFAFQEQYCHIQEDLKVRRGGGGGVGGEKAAMGCNSSKAAFTKLPLLCLYYGVVACQNKNI